jgi:hypothetical protein
MTKPLLKNPTSPAVEVSQNICILSIVRENLYIQNLVQQLQRDIQISERVVQHLRTEKSKSEIKFRGIISQQAKEVHRLRCRLSEVR